MNHQHYQRHVTEFTQEMLSVTEVKNHDYSVRDDAMDNFKLVGEILGISPRLVWSVLWMKHVTAVVNHMAKDKTLKDETIHGRFIDLANYAMLGDALDKDLAQPENSDGLEVAVSVLNQIITEETQKNSSSSHMNARRLTQHVLNYLLQKHADSRSHNTERPVHGHPQDVSSEAPRILRPKCDVRHDDEADSPIRTSLATNS